MRFLKDTGAALKFLLLLTLFKIYSQTPPASVNSAVTTSDVTSGPHYSSLAMPSTSALCWSVSDLKFSMSSAVVVVVQWLARLAHDREVLGSHPAATQS